MPIVVGHRGARGLEPENTLKAFEEALKLGAKGLEMDLFMTKDGQVVVTHDATISSDLCLAPNGNPLDEQESGRLKIYQLNYEQIKPFDCGSVDNTDFPAQENTEAHIPLLEDVIEKASRYSSPQAPLVYLMEIKSDPSTDGHTHPAPAFFVKQVLEIIASKKAEKEAVIISFDKRVLLEVRKQNKHIRVGLSIVELPSLDHELEELGFVPDVLCPLHKKLNKEFMEKAWTRGLTVIPWTVNKKEDQQRVLELQVDGLITDYPDNALKLIKEGL